MVRIIALLFFFCALPAAAQPVPPLDANSAIDIEGFLRVSSSAAEHRATRRVPEEAFARMSREGAFPSKLPSASLNLSTYVALYNYGYRNVYELADTVDLKGSKLEFEPARR